MTIYYERMKASQIRKSRGLSQTDLAEMVGVEQPSISRFERGHDGITLRMIRQVAAALDVSVAELFTEDDRDEAEKLLIKVFRSMPEDRQRGWIDMARTFVPEE